MAHSALSAIADEIQRLKKNGVPSSELEAIWCKKTDAITEYDPPLPGDDTTKPKLNDEFVRQLAHYKSIAFGD